MPIFKQNRSKNVAWFAFLNNMDYKMSLNYQTYTVSRPRLLMEVENVPRLLNLVARERGVFGDILSALICAIYSVGSQSRGGVRGLLLSQRVQPSGVT